MHQREDEGMSAHMCQRERGWAWECIGVHAHARECAQKSTGERQKLHFSTKIIESIPSSSHYFLLNILFR